MKTTIYIDNWLLVAQSLQQPWTQVSLLTWHMATLGFMVNWEESSYPNSEHRVHSSVSGLSRIHSTSVSVKSGGISGSSGALLQGNKTEIQDVSFATGPYNWHWLVN